MPSLALNVPVAYKDAPSAIIYMPEGEHEICATVNGKPDRQRVLVDRSCLPNLKRDLDAMCAAGRARPVCFFDHNSDGPASFIPAEFDYIDGVGVILKGDWTQAGRAAIEGRNYSYFSPDFRINRATCKPIGLNTHGVEIGSLVNDPAFENIARIVASRATLADFTIFDDPGEDTGIAKPEKEQHTQPDMLDLLVKLGILSAEDAAAENAQANAEAALTALLEKAKAPAAPVEAAKEEDPAANCPPAKTEAPAEDKKEDAAALSASNARMTQLEAEIAELKASRTQLIEAEIDAAVQAGKIAPQNETVKGAVRAALTADIKAGKALIESMNPNPAFAPVIAGKTNPAQQDSDLFGRDRLAAEIEKEN